MLRWNPQGDYPRIDNSAYIDTTAVIIGNVTIGQNVFIGPLSVIRGDEPDSSIIIKDNSNIQDRVIIHALGNDSVIIEENVSLAHGCIIHGPCKIGKDSFVGFGSVVFNAELGNGVFVKHLATVENISISANKLIKSGQSINGEAKEKALKKKDDDFKIFARNVVKTNLDLVSAYSKKF